MIQTVLIHSRHLYVFYQKLNMLVLWLLKLTHYRNQHIIYLLHIITLSVASETVDPICCAIWLGWVHCVTYWKKWPLRGIKDWVNEDAHNGSIWKFDLVLRKWKLFRTVTLSLSEQFGWELPTVTWYVGCTAGRQYRELHIGLDCYRSGALWSPGALSQCIPTKVTLMLYKLRALNWYDWLSYHLPSHLR